MSKFLYPIKKLKVEPWIKYWLIKKSAGSILPAEYQQVDYIESSGTQYIDTGYKPNERSEYELDFEFAEFYESITGFVFGSRISGTQEATGFTANVSSINKYNYLGRGSFYAEIRNNELSLNTNYNFKIKNDGFIVNGITKDTTQNTLTGIATFNLYIFNSNNGSLSTGSKIKLKKFKIYENNVTVKNFIPCYRKSDNVVGLYDLVNKVFYTNAGTGAFTYGSEV